MKVNCAYFVLFIVVFGWFASPKVVQSATVLASMGTTVRQFDSVTGTDLGVYASGFTSASGIGFDASNGFIYVADYGADTVTKFTSSGSTSFGSGFSDPEGVAVDAFGNVYVANYGNFTVTKFNSSGSLLNTLNLGGGRAEGLAFAENGDLLVNIYTGTNAGKIQRYDSSGAFLNTFATPGGNLAPIVVDDSGNVYVTRLSGSNTLFKYDSSGSLVDSTALGFNSSGLAITDDGYLLVSDTIGGGSSIHKFDLALNPAGTFASTPSAPGYLAVVPEPSRTLLLSLGIVSLLMRRRRR